MLYPESTWARFEQEFPIPEKYRKYYEYKNWHIEPKSSDLSQFEQDHPFAFMLMPEDMQHKLYLWTKGLAKRKTINSEYTHRMALNIYSLICRVVSTLLTA